MPGKDKTVRDFALAFVFTRNFNHANIPPMSITLLDNYFSIFTELD